MKTKRALLICRFPWIVLRCSTISTYGLNSTYIINLTSLLNVQLLSGWSTFYFIRCNADNIWPRMVGIFFCLSNFMLSCVTINLLMCNKYKIIGFVTKLGDNTSIPFNLFSMPTFSVDHSLYKGILFPSLICVCVNVMVKSKRTFFFHLELKENLYIVDLRAHKCGYCLFINCIQVNLDKK